MEDCDAAWTDAADSFPCFCVPSEFGFYANSLDIFREKLPPYKIGGIFDYHVIMAGFMGGFGRGLAEGPFEYIKVRRQVEGTWRFREVFQGSGVTMLRNAFLFSSFVVYIDLSKQIVPGGLGPFLEAVAHCHPPHPLSADSSRVHSGGCVRLPSLVHHLAA